MTTQTNGLTPEKIAQLEAPFPVEAHELRDGGWSEGKLPYLTEDPLRQRLNEVDPNWSFRIVEIQQTNYGLAQPDIVNVHAEMTVCGVTRASNGVTQANVKRVEWVTGPDGRRQKRELDPPIVLPLTETEVKGAVTDALKRCARLFGVGAYLLQSYGMKFKSEADFAAWYRRVVLGEAPSQPQRPAPANPKVVQLPQRPEAPATDVQDSEAQPVSRADRSTRETGAAHKDELPPVAQEQVNAYDAMTDKRPLSQTTLPQLQQWIMGRYPNVTNISHASNTIIKALQEEGKLRADAGWAAVFGNGFVVAAVAEAVDRYKSAESNARAAEEPAQTE